MDTLTADRLHENLTRQYAAHEELLRALQAQQQAIRRFDAEALEKLRERCDLVAQRISELEEARQHLTGPNVRLAELANRLPEPQRSRLAAMAAGLKKLSVQTASLNRVNQSAVQNMLNHFHTIYQLMAGGGRDGLYSASGRSAGSGGRAFLVDAVA